MVALGRWVQLNGLESRRQDLLGRGREGSSCAEGREQVDMDDVTVVELEGNTADTRHSCCQTPTREVGLHLRRRC